VRAGSPPFAPPGRLAARRGCGMSESGWPLTPSTGCCLECNTVMRRRPVRDRDRDLGTRWVSGGHAKPKDCGQASPLSCVRIRMRCGSVHEPTVWILGSDCAAVCVRP
jgi:hypothetical protein